MAHLLAMVLVLGGGVRGGVHAVILIHLAGYAQVNILLPESLNQRQVLQISVGMKTTVVYSK